MRRNHPVVSIVILNYFGEKVIEKTVTSVFNSRYPSSRYEVIVVDNHSQDQSHRILTRLSRKYPRLKLLFLPQNLGFAAGNNRGISLARGDYVALLNNDCIVDSNWLSELTKLAKSSPKIFAVTSKILIYSKYLELTLSRESSDILQTCRLTNSNLLKFSKKKYLDLSFTCNQKVKINLPYDPFYDSEVQLELKFTDKPSQTIIQTLSDQGHLSPLKTKSTTITLKIDTKSSKVISHSYYKIQNAGSMVFQDGYSRDIGAKVKYLHQDYEADTGQYDSPNPVYAICGAAALFNRKLLKTVGPLDETFFFYYEDTEISERARLMGYQNFFCPKAVVHHLHAFSSQEWSPFFLFNSEKGRLLHTFYHFPLGIFLNEYLKFLFSLPIKSHRLSHFQVVLWFPLHLVSIVKKRHQYHQQYPPTAIQSNFQQILSGYWLVN